MVATKHPKLSKKWRALLGLIPGYCPFESAAPGDWFDPKAAQRALDFFQHPEDGLLWYTEGAKAGERFNLEPWQESIVANLFGWKRPDGYRRYRECFLYVAKKNGKTTFSAGILLYMLVCDNEAGAKVYSAASKREQAAIVFGYAAAMVRAEPELAKRLTVYGEWGGAVSKSIAYSEKGAFYRSLSADSKKEDGLHPSCSIVDELHAHRTPELAGILRKGTKGRRQPLTLYTSTADYNHESLCNTMLKRCRLILVNGGDKNKPGYAPEFLPVIYEASIDDDWEDPETWKKANPNLGVTMTLEDFEADVRLARDSPSEWTAFLRFNLNIVTDSDVAWIDMDKWDACKDPEFSATSLEGETCYAGLDMSSTADTTALVLLFPGQGNAILPFIWIPGESAYERDRRDAVPYTSWIRDGHVKSTEGNVVDYDVIRADINELGKKYNIREIAIDRWESTQLQTQLTGDGFEVFKFGQGFASMKSPTREFERLVISGGLRHDGNPAARWMVSNTMVEMDAAGSMKASKSKSTGRIDFVISAVMALGQALIAEPEPDGPLVVFLSNSYSDDDEDDGEW